MLETKIEELTKAIEKLTEVIMMDVRGELTPEQPHPVEVKKKTTVEEAPQVTPESESVQHTHEDLTQLMIEAARAGKKDESRAVMKDNGYKKMSEIPLSDIARLYEMVKGLL